MIQAMRFLFTCLIIAILSCIAQIYMPWWIIIVLAAIIVYFAKLNPGKGFLAGFLGIAFVWAGYAFLLSAGNDGILAQKIGQLFGGLSASLLILITAAVGGLLGGLSGLTGSLARRL